ncbi:flagellar hook-basal body protein [Cohnella cholangitidis]|uniref:Flagellar hook-basal body protein n=1 Tax=Cohnella cholangitidis TaxID=2598458 RepID=A0A7G5BXP9_9BACL|nr:flagellar hook-basal body protein [Cohnella cholangitidis]QMV41733.1 flagellar hook-basal body protein [Cohnella cholangitidis]
MNNSMITASVSMGALQQKLDMLADNFSNSNTVGYKRKTAVFEDILTSLNPHLEEFNQPGRRTPLGFTQGWGARLTSIQTDMSQGVLQQTGNMTDVAIEGNGLFEVRTNGDINGARAFTRHGPFQLMPDANGDRILVTNSGQQVVGETGAGEDFIRVPAGYNLTIALDGTLTGVGAEGTAPIDLGRLKLVEVTNSELLQAVADNLYGVPENVDPANVVRDIALLPNGESGIAVRQGFVEQSNVNMADEMTDLMIVQRAYQLSARALSSSEQMMGMTNNLRG